MPINSGDTAWILVAAALVMLMTPGLALFYGGMVRRKNVLSTMMMSFAMLGLVGILWVLFGYSLSFGPDKAGIKTEPTKPEQPGAKHYPGNIVRFHSLLLLKALARA